jgi:hypothetical protein
MAELKAKGICDFCGEACNADMQGAKAYDCADFPMESGVMSYGAWGACPDCAALIDGEEWTLLGDRMTETHAEGLKRKLKWLGFLLTVNQLEQMRRMHAEQIGQFRHHRIGGPSTVHLDADFVLAIDDAKKSGRGLEYILQTNGYKKILAAMEAEGTRTHEQNVRYLNEVCESVMAEVEPLTDDLRMFANRFRKH